MPDLQHQQTHPIDAAVLDKTAQCLALRIRGYSYRRIAKALDISKSQCHKYVIAAMQELRDENSESAIEVRQLELERLDEQAAALWDGTVVSMTPEISNSLLRIGERRAKLLGLDAPTDNRFGGIPGGAAIPVQSRDIDLSKLSTAALIELEAAQAVTSDGNDFRDGRLTDAQAREAR